MIKVKKFDEDYIEITEWVDSIGKTLLVTDRGKTNFRYRYKAIVKNLELNSSYNDLRGIEFFGWGATVDKSIQKLILRLNHNYDYFTGEYERFLFFFKMKVYKEIPKLKHTIRYEQ